MNKRSGFTIVELLVVIVIIGVLAAITTVSYSGISQRVTVASIQSDLASSRAQFKIFQVNNGNYPTSFSTDCSSQPDTTTNKCLKLSNGNQVDRYDYNNSSNPQTFTLIIKDKNGNNKYQITEGGGPTLATVNPVIFNNVPTGCSTTTDGGLRAHTCGPGTYNLTADNSGTITVTINGGGGGGGGGAGTDECGTANGSTGDSGSESFLMIGTAKWIAGPGGGGTGETEEWVCGVYHNGTNGGDGSTQVQGGATMTGWSSQVNSDTGGVGGGGAGGAGGNSARLVGTVAVTSGQLVTITVGSGGSGGLDGWGGPSGAGGSGASGSVIVSYPN